MASSLLFNVSTVPCEQPIKMWTENSSASLFTLCAYEAHFLAYSKYQHWHRGKQGLQGRRYLASGLMSAIQHNKIWTDILPLPCLHCALLKHPPYQIPNISIGIEGSRDGGTWHLASFPLFNVRAIPSRATNKNMNRNSSASMFALSASESLLLIIFQISALASRVVGEEIFGIWRHFRYSTSAQSPQEQPIKI